MSSVVLSPATGQTVSISPNWTAIQLNPATNLPRLKLALPSLEQTDASFVLQTSKAITNLDIDIGTARKIQGMPIQLSADESLTFVYTGLTQTWSVTNGGLITPDYAASTYYILGTNPLIVQVDTSGSMQNADLAFILRQGALVGLNLAQLRPPAATLLGGDGNGFFTALATNPTLSVVSGKLQVNVGTTAGTVAAGDALATTTALASAALARSGGTMTGAITLAADPTAALHPATKQYVDGSLASISTTASSALTQAGTAVTTASAAMPRSGGTFTGFITLNAAPTSTLHPATKGYVDTGVAAAVSNAASALTAATAAQTTANSALAQGSNLSDLGSAAQARLNLGLGSAAVLSVGQGHGQVAAGDDPRILGALQNTIFGTPGGVATLDIYGRLNAAQIPLSLLGAMVYQGTWNPATNTPLLQSGVGSKGQYYVVSVTSAAATLDGVSQFNVGDWVVFDGQRWDKLDGVASEVLSVVGNTGAVTLAQLVTGGVAPLASPALTGAPTAPSPTSSDNSTRITNTAWVTANFLKSVGGSLTGATVENSPIGATTANTGRFTTITLTGAQTGSFVLAAPTAGGSPLFRQLGYADIGGLAAMATQAASSVAITGGTMDGVAIGGSAAAAGRFTALTLTSNQTAKYVLAAPTGAAGAPTFRQLTASDLAGLGTIASQSAGAVALTGGTVDGVAIGGTTPAAGGFTSLGASAAVTFGSASSLVVGPATGGNKGAGSINATAIYVNGQAVGIAGGYALPAATPTTLGGVVIPATTGVSGSNLTVDGSGNLSVVWSAPGSIGATTPAAGTFTSLSATGSVAFTGTGALAIPAGTTGQQPGTPAQGMIRYNSTTQRFEGYTGTTWVSHVQLSGDTMAGTLNVSSIAVTGGSINGAVIGGTTPASAKFTTIQASDVVTLTSTSSVVVGAAAGGNQGVGTINAVGLFVNGVAVSTGATSPATATAAGLVIVPAGGGLSVDGSGNLSVNWAAPGAIGATTANTGRFTTLTLTSSQTASYVLAAPNGSSGVPTFRQLASGDISGLGTLATQAASSVAITGGSIDNVAIGATTAKTGRFTTLALTSAQAASTVLAAAIGGGAPVFRQLSASDLTGLGSMSAQNAGSVAITGGSLAAVSMTGITSIAFELTQGSTKLALYSTTYGIGVNTSELTLFADSSASVRFRNGGMNGAAIFNCDANGVQNTQIGSSGAASGRFTTVTATNAGSSIAGIPTSSQVAPVGATINFSGPVTPGTYVCTLASPFSWTVQTVYANTGSVGSSSMTFQVTINGTAVTFGGGSSVTATNGSISATATGGNTVAGLQNVSIVVTSVSGSPANGSISLNGARTGLN